jgi:hypothetical protein
LSKEELQAILPSVCRKKEHHQMTDSLINCLNEERERERERERRQACHAEQNIFLDWRM